LQAEIEEIKAKNTESQKVLQTQIDELKAKLEEQENSPETPAENAAETPATNSDTPETDPTSTPEAPAPAQESSVNDITKPPSIDREFQDIATVSDTSRISAVDAERRAEEEMREKFSKMARLDPNRIRYFVRRSAIKANKIKKLRKKDPNLKDKKFDRSDAHTAAAGRHAQESKLNSDQFNVLELDE